MKISAINTYNQNYSRKNITKVNVQKKEKQTANTNSIAFKGDKGGAIGIVAGAALGALGAAAIIATGGLAGVVAAIGYSSTVAAGAASCTHIGGIAGSIIEDKFKK